MFVDILIVVSAVIFFLIFLGIHIVTFRTTGDSEVLKKLVYNVVIVGVFQMISVVIAVRQASLSLVVAVVALTFVLYMLMAWCYILGIFGITVTSVRMQILSEIANSASNGITSGGLMKKYNRKRMIAQRLFRLVSSGELKKVGGRYLLRRKISPFLVHMYLQRILFSVYN